MEKNIDTNNENAIEFFTNARKATVSFTQTKWVNKMKRYAQQYPNDIKLIENNDGSICCTVPIKWVKLSPPRKVNLTTDQKAERADRMRKIAQKRNKTTR